MKKFDIFFFALRNFLRRKARSVLTITGVVIGTAAIVIMISIGNALNINQIKQLESWGSLTIVTVYPGMSGGGGGMIRVGGGTSDSSTLNEEALASIEGIEHVKGVMPWKNDSMILVSGKYLSYASLMICDSSKLEAFDIEADEGRLVTPEDGPAAFFGYSVGQSFYNPKSTGGYMGYMGSMSGETDKYGNPLPVVDVMNDQIKFTFDMTYGQPNPTPDPGNEISEGQGTVASKPKLIKLKATGVGKPNTNESWGIIMDLSEYVKLKKDYLKSVGGASMQNDIKRLSAYDYFQVKVDDMNNVASVSKALTDMGYQAYSMMDAVNQMKEQSRMIQLILGGIGGMSLLVAAIGIANTMIMSIYERTREIGVMKVIGCRLSDIRSLFLTEAGIIGLTGGLAGVGFSYLASAVLNHFSDAFSSAMGGGGYTPTGEPTEFLVSAIPPWLSLAAVAFAMAVGLISGFYPAWRAMRLSALEAIRNE